MRRPVRGGRRGGAGGRRHRARHASPRRVPGAPHRPVREQGGRPLRPRRDLLRKTTLDEVPALFQVATLYALLVWLAEGAIVAGQLRHRQVIGIWAMLFLLIAISRAVARRLVAHRAAQPERCLVVGDADSAEPVRRKLRSNLELNAPAGRPRAARRRGARRPTCSAASTTWAIILAEHDDRSRGDRARPVGPELMLRHDPDVKALGVKVSVLPRLFEVVGSSVEFDDLDGMPLLGVRRLRPAAVLARAQARASTSSAPRSCLLAARAVAARSIALADQARLAAGRCSSASGGSAATAGVRDLKFRTMVDGADAHEAELLRAQRGRRGPVQDRRRPPHHPRRAASCARPRSTSCPSCSTSCAAR